MTKVTAVGALNLDFLNLLALLLAGTGTMAQL